MHDDDEDDDEHISDRIPFGLIQVLTIALVGCAAIYIGVENGTLIGAWSVMGAIAVTWLIGKGIDARRFGLRSVLPGWRPFLKVSGAVLLVVAGITAIITALVFIEMRFDLPFL